jgi:hypothetical protein
MKRPKTANLTFTPYATRPGTCPALRPQCRLVPALVIPESEAPLPGLDGGIGPHRDHRVLLLSATRQGPPKFSELGTFPGFPLRWPLLAVSKKISPELELVEKKISEGGIGGT